MHHSLTRAHVLTHSAGDRLDAAEPIFTRLGQLAASGRAEGAASVTRKALQRALELHRVQFTQRLLGLPGASACLERIDMIALYAQELSKSRFLSSSRLGETLERISIDADHEPTAAPEQLDPAAPGHNSRDGLSGANGASSFSCKLRPPDGKDKSFRRSHTFRRSTTTRRRIENRRGGAVLTSSSALRRYQKLVPFFASISPQLGGVVASEHRVDASAIMLWATMAGQHAMSTLFWPLCDHPLLMALICGFVCRHAASCTQRAEIADSMLAQGTLLEGCFTGTIEPMEPLLAHRVLSQPVRGLKGLTLLELAMLLEMKQACSHRHAQSLMDLAWRGGGADDSKGFAPEPLPEGYPYHRLALHVLLPFYPPAGRRAARMQSVKGSTEFLMQAVLATMRTRSEEEARAVSHTCHTDISEAAGQTAAGSHARMQSEIKNILGTETRAIPPKSRRSHQGGDRHPFSHLIAFYRIPAVSFVLRFDAHLLCLAACAVQLQLAATPQQLDALRPELPPFSSIEAFQLVNTLAMSCDRLLKVVDCDPLYSPHQSRSPLKRSLLQIDWLFFAAAVVRIASMLASEYATRRALYSVHLGLLSVHGVSIVLGLLPFLGRVLAPLGVLILAIEQMLAAVAMFILFSLVLIGAMCFGLMGFSRSGSFDDDPSHGFDRLSWYLTPAFAYVSPPFSNIAQFDGVSSCVMLIYLFFTTKVLQSLINAIFAGAITKIFRESAIEYVWLQHQSLFNHRHVLLAVPPPLNLPIVIYVLGRVLSRVVQRGIGTVVMADADLTTVGVNSKRTATTEAHGVGSNAKPIAVGLYVEQYRASEAQKKVRSIEHLVSSLIEQQHSLRADFDKQMAQLRSATEQNQLTLQRLVVGVGEMELNA